ncbi:unnamed protein product [Phaedon cochleariae]|uniref:Uncharacterized protein n=1 Tax=Phaedon cochleariae TaxID=80249 RepID=A0A9P0GN19_PHACE|nr:unnamed protein product [Phaedon cochleariae]
MPLSPPVQEHQVSTSDESTQNITEITNREENDENEHHQEDEVSSESEDCDDDIKDPDFEYDKTDTESESEIEGEIEGESESIVDELPATSVNVNSANEESGRSDGNEEDILNQKKDDGSCQTGVSTEFKTNGEKRKGNKTKNFCLYCCEPVLNFCRHLIRNHKYESQVLKICSYSKGSKERKELLTVLRKEGNFINKNQQKKPMKRPVTNENILPCDNCKGFYSSKTLWRHRRKCTGAIGKQHQVRGENILLRNLKTDTKLKETVFPRMMLDGVSRVAKEDVLICAFGSKYLKTHRDKHCVNIVSRKMRELAKLLIEMKKHNPAIQNFFEALNPAHFDILVEAAKSVAKYNSETESFGSPSFAVNIRPSIIQCCEIAILYALKRKSVYGTIIAANAEADLKTLIRLVESQWHSEVSSQAMNDLNMNKFNKITIVPLASDLKLLKEYLISRSQSSIEQLRTDCNNVPAFITLLETIYCRIILLNRRRPGELQRLPLHLYEKVETNSSNYEEFSSVVTPTEKILLENFRRVVIKGKRGRGVPILISPDVQENIKVLLDLRKNFINPKNVYFFANVGTLQPISGYKVLRKYASNCGAKNPNALTATRLRKHLATLCQVFSMSENDIEQLATFMGHTVGIHRGSYRMPDDVYQTATISKLLLLMEKGEANKFKGKTLNEIDLNLEENLLEIDQDKAKDTIGSDGESENEDLNMPTDPEETAPSVTEKPSNESKQCKRVLVPWTDKQRTVVKDFFKTNIVGKIPPKKNECLVLKEMHPDLLKNKDWLKIKVFVQNEYMKKKK